LLFRIYRRQMRIPAGTLADMAAMIADGEYCLPALILEWTHRVHELLYHV
jgi:hypothetical protein